ncbi:MULTISPECIES: SRPBCC family protein [unclassified Frankia]|uniref:SRPBCC family protein n=1 Tax=unclassified Frankia TaxID=2632575 RepID=UPI0020257E3C
MHHETTVRVHAPIGEVWTELERLDDILRRSPEISGPIQVDEDGAHRIKVRLSWGPLSRLVDATAHIDSAIPPHQLTWSIRVPSLDVLSTQVFDLTSVAEDETSLRYVAEVDCGHRYPSKLRRVLPDHVEEHVESMASRIGTLAAQHWQSKQRLLFRSGPAA